MRSHFRVVIGSVIGISIVMVLTLGLRLGGEGLVKIAGYFPILGALIGACLVLISVRLPIHQQENVEPWLKRERLAWTLIGCGIIPWGLSELLWDYYLAQGQNPFPSPADIGYSTVPLLIFAGLILQPSPKSSHKRIFLLLDSLITMGALLSIGWFFLLGPLAQNPAQSPLAKFLSLYYPIADIALLSCTTFLLLRGSGHIYRAPARRIGLLVLGLGLSIFATSDFLFNTLSNMGLYQSGSWVDIGWPLGMMTIGVAGYLRRFQPDSNVDSSSKAQVKDTAKQLQFGPAQLLPYILLVILLVVLGINVLSSDNTQQSIRPVLFVATLIVIGLVIIRQIMTMHENDILMHDQINTLKKLEKVYHEVEDRKIELENGITHLKEIQTRLANGDVHARAQITSGDLWPLAIGLNLMADRMMRFEHDQKHAQKLAKALSDLSVALEGGKGNKIPLVLPASCLDVPELHRLLNVLGLKPPAGNPSPLTHLPPTTFQHQPSASSGTKNNFPSSTQRATP